MSLRLVIASYNQKKLKELKELLRDMSIELLSLGNFPNVKEVDEDGATFRENAEKKALGYANQTGCLTLAEDSGLSVDYLNGEPGVYSARFSGPAKDDLENCQKVLQLMENVPDNKRGASFQSAASLAIPGKILYTVQEKVEGRIANEMRGDGGFGYDPLFFYPKFGKTLAEVSAEMKHSVSHRGKALQKIKIFLTDYLKSGT